MSATAAAPAPATTGDQAADRCAFCGAALEQDQEWCLECGVGRTIVRSPPDWRIPLAVVGTIVLAALIALAIALIDLSGTGTGTKAATATPPKPTVTRPAVAALPTVATWPAGLSGWTVELSEAPDQATAQTTASQLAAAGLSVGVLSTSDHPLMHPSGQWIVFSGRYPTQAQAQAQAAKLVAADHAGATAREVAGSGGI